MGRQASLRQALTLSESDGSVIIVPAGACLVDDRDENLVIVWATPTEERRASLSTDQLSLLLARRELVYVSW